MTKANGNNTKHTGEEFSKYKLEQELKFLYNKKERLNEQLYTGLLISP